jgi:hypothetical protein
VNATSIQLPGEAEVQVIDDDLQHGLDELERLTWTLRDFNEHDGTDLELPEVTLEHVAALATLRRDLHYHLDRLQQFTAKVETSLDAAVVFRAEQQSRAKRQAD